MPAAKVRLTTNLGSTETGPVPTERTDAEDGAYAKFSPSLSHKSELVSEDLYDLVIVREDNNSSTGKDVPKPLQAAFRTLPESAEYRTRDFDSKHPSKDNNLWLYRGRRDDLIERSDEFASSPRMVFPVPMDGSRITSADQVLRWSAGPVKSGHHYWSRLASHEHQFVLYYIHTSRSCRRLLFTARSACLFHAFHPARMFR